MKKLWLKFELWMAKLHREGMFDACRRTGGDASPFLEDYLKLDAECRAIEEKIRAL